MWSYFHLYWVLLTLNLLLLFIQSFKLVYVWRSAVHFNWQLFSRTHLGYGGKACCKTKVSNLWVALMWRIPAYEITHILTLFSWTLLSNCLNWKINCDDHSSLASTTAVQILIYIFFTSFHSAHELHDFCMNSINWSRSQCVAWVHGSVGRSSHQYRGGHGFKSCWSPDFFRLLSNSLNWKINCDYHSSLASTTAVRIICHWIISYTLHVISLCTGDMNSINWPRSQCVAS